MLELVLDDIHSGKDITDTGEITNYTDNIEDDSELEFDYDPDFVAPVSIII